MFPTTLDTFKNNEKELHRRAAHYRLVRSLEKSSGLADLIFTALGQMLIAAGQNLVQRTQAAH